MHEDIFAGLRGDEAVALVGVEPFHGSNRHVLIPPPPVLEASTHAGPTLAPTAGDKLDLRVARQNPNPCRAHHSRCGQCLSQPGSRACRAEDDGYAWQLLMRKPLGVASKAPGPAGQRPCMRGGCGAGQIAEVDEHGAEVAAPSGHFGWSAP